MLLLDKNVQSQTRKEVGRACKNDKSFALVFEQKLDVLTTLRKCALGVLQKRKNSCLYTKLIKLPTMVRFV